MYDACLFYNIIYDNLYPLGNNMSLNIFLTILTIIIACVATWIAFINARFQIVMLILNQLSDKAKQTNEHLNKEKMKIHFNIKSNVSGFISSIVTAEQLLNYNFKEHWFLLLGAGKQGFIDQFYLQLHTSIRQYVGRDIESTKQSLDAFCPDQQLLQQFNNVCKFLDKSFSKFQ